MGNSVLVDGLTTTSHAPTLESRIVEGTLRCVARWGVSKTTLDDIAREAGCSRATVYRVFPGGKERLLEAVAHHEVGRFFDLVAQRLDAATDLDDLVVTGMTAAMRFIAEHDALRYLVTHEPHLVLPYLAFHRLDQFLALTRSLCVPYFERFLSTGDATAAADLVARLVLSYSFDPSEDVDPYDVESMRRLVRTFVLPGLVPLTPRGAST